MQLMFIPSLVSNVAGSAFNFMEHLVITVEPGHSHFTFVGSFFIDAAGMRRIRYFDLSKEVIVGAKVQIISTGYFISYHSHISSLVFAHGSDLRQIEEGAFDLMSHIESIPLPRSMEQLDEK
jgi:hypothetical protein